MKRTSSKHNQQIYNVFGSFFMDTESKDTIRLAGLFLFFKKEETQSLSILALYNKGWCKKVPKYFVPQQLLHIIFQIFDQFFKKYAS